MASEALTTQPHPEPQVRAAEIAAALCLATDLSMGFQWGHGLAATLSAMRLCDLVGVDSSTRQDTYYLSLLTYVGCTADAAEKSGIYGGPITENIVGVIWGSQLEKLRVVTRMVPEPGASPVAAAVQLARGMPKALAHHPREQLALCEVAQMTSRRLGLPESVADTFHYLTERWDGGGALKRARGDELPLALRIALVARDGSFLATVGGQAYASRIIQERAGRAHDPQIAKLLAKHSGDVLHADPAQPTDTVPWEDVLAAEKGGQVTLTGPRVEDALGALGDFAELPTPSFRGHASVVAHLAHRASGIVGMDAAAASRTRCAALVQDVGRVSVPAHVWEKAEPLTADEWERVRLHPYYSERVCSRSPFLRDLGRDAACHHERLDGSGFHRGLGAEALSMTARILAAADAFQTLRQPGFARAPVALADAADQLAEQVKEGRVDADAVGAIVEAAGGVPRPLPRPAGLTPRETQVVALIARGLATKQVARRLGISAKTADHHIQNSYRKIGVSSRSALTLFAMQHGLLAWGELPMEGRSMST